MIEAGASTGKCEACDSTNYYCKTCGNSADDCRSCISGYKLEGIKCISTINVDGRMRLNTTPANFMVGINRWKRAILSLLGSKYNNLLYLITINKLTEGSTIVDYTVTAPEGEVANDAFLKIS